MKKRISVPAVVWANIAKWQTIRNVSDKQIAGILGLSRLTHGISYKMASLWRCKKMIDYDATDTDIQVLQAELAEYGITKAMCDLSKYAGCTFSELRSIQKAVIKRHRELAILKGGNKK